MLRLARSAGQRLFVRVLMFESSHTAGGGDPRDSLGFALREVYVAGRDSTARFTTR